MRLCVSASSRAAFAAAVRALAVTGCASLTTSDTDATNRIKPQLASGMPEVGDGGRKVAVGARRGARFSDGTPLDATAVGTSLKRHRDLPAAARSTELEPVKSIEALGDHKVELRLKEPYEPPPGALADRSGTVMPPRALKKYGEDFATHLSCAGPSAPSSPRQGERRRLWTTAASTPGVPSRSDDAVRRRPSTTLPGPDGGRLVACGRVADDGTAPDAAVTADSGA